MVVVGETMVFVDTMGAIWTVPAKGGESKQISDAQATGFAFHPVVVGSQVLVSTKKGFVRVALPSGPVTPVGLVMSDTPEEVIADDKRIYMTLFQKDDIMAYDPIAKPWRLTKLKRGVLAQHGDTLYAISYATGNLIAVPKGGGTAKPIAGGPPRPTALAVDDTYAYVYSEKTKELTRIELASGAEKTLAEGLENSDDLVLDGAYVYTFSWAKPAGSLVRIAKDGSTTEVLVSDLASPSHIAVDSEAVYVTSRDQNKIVRIRK